jgi:transcriptional regulator with XRE-family HTH domain
MTTFRFDMTANQYKSIRESIGITQVELAKYTGVTSKAISERERGVVKISKEAEMAISMLKKTK